MAPFNWQLLWKKTKLDKFDYVVCTIIGVIIVLLIVVASLAGSGTSVAVKQTLGESLNEKITNVFYWLDSFEIASSAVTFLFWGAVGLVLYIIVSSLVSMSREVSFEHDLSSDEYVHPTSKSKKDIVRAETINAVVLIASLLLLAVVIGGFIFGVLPAVIINARTAVLHPTAQNILGLIAATVVMVVCLCATWTVTKVARHRRLIVDA